MSLEDAANIFGAQLGGEPGGSMQRAAAPVTIIPPQQLFGDRQMEGGDDAGYGEVDGPDEGGDAAEEERESRPRLQPQKEGEPRRDRDTGRFMKNEGPIDDGEEDGEGDGANEGGERKEEGDDSRKELISGLDPDHKLTIKVDGQDQEVTLKEATEGYIRTKTFHQRMTALDSDKQVLDRDRANYSAALEQSQQGLERILLELKAAEPAEPDWDKLYRENPTEAARQKVLWDRYQGGKAELLKQHQEVVGRRNQEQQESMRRYVSGEANKLLTKFPHWKDSAARERDQSAIKTTLKKAGFTDQEVSTVFDSRMVEIAMKAARFDRLSSQTGLRRSNTKPMPSGSGAPSRRTGSGNGNRALRSHMNTQTVDSAAGAIHSILQQE